MKTLISEAEIQRLVSELKPLPRNLLSPVQLTGSGAHLRLDQDIQGVSGSRFRIIVRQSTINLLDFSVILAHMPLGSNKAFRLRRYNGRAPHTNHLEKTDTNPDPQLTVYLHDFHIHMATERYQESGWKEDHYAEPSEKFFDLPSAIQCLIEDCAIVLPSSKPPPFFGMGTLP